MESKPSMTGLQGLTPGDPLDSARLLGVALALAGEVFVLKTEVERLKHALKTTGAIDDAHLETAGAASELQQWMQAEQTTFARTLLRPFTHPDEAPDVTRFMDER